MPAASSRLIVPLFAAALALPVPAAAQDSLLERAKQAVKSFGGSSSGSAATAGLLSDGEIGRGLKEALRVGTERVVNRVGARNGFFADKKIHIPLPKSLRRVQSALRAIGLAELADDLELRLNRAAEAAAPEAKELFWQAISDMKLADVRRIYNGRKDEATRYFKRRMSKQLGRRMGPVIDRSLADVGAIRSYDAMIGRYKSLPLVPDVKADLTAYVVDKAIAGVFHYVAKEEAAIRRDPAKRTTALLRRVFR
jgi:hypothetical protein